jgi:WD40 repeat protein
VNPERWADELIGRVERARPEVVRLAELASLAAQVDAPLLRRLRQQFLPGSDPGLEADLWFSPLLEAQDDECGTFHEPVVLRLRERLRIRLQATDEPAFNRVASLTRTAHAHLPEALRLEELLTAWAIRAEIWDRTHMEQALAPALGALAGADDAHALEVARWAMQAAGRLPQSVRSLLPMQALLVASALRLQQPSLASTAAGPLTLAATDLSWLVPVATDAARVRLGVALLPHGVRFEEPEGGGLAFELPRTTPLLVSLGWRDTAGPHQRLAQVAPGTLVEIEGDFGAVELVTLAGERYTLSGTLAGKATVTVAASAPPGDAAPKQEGVPGAFLDGCVLVEDLGATMGLAIAFPLAKGLWVSPREPFGAIPFVGVMDPATAEQMELANRDDEGAVVSLWRPLSTNRRGEPLPLLAAAAAPSDADWWTVTFVDGRPQVTPVRPREGPRGEIFEIETAAPVRFPGAPVLCASGGLHGTVADIAVVGIVTAVQSDANANAPSTGRLRVLSASALQAALERSRVGAVPDSIPHAAVTCARFLPGGRDLLVGSGDGTLRVYDGDSGALTSELAAHDGSVLSLALLRSPDGTIASGGSDRTLRVSRPGSHAPTRTVRIEAAPRALAGHSEANTLTVGGANGLLQALTSDSLGWTPYLRRDPAEPLAGGLNALAAIPEGDRVVSAADDGRLVVWSRRELQPLFELLDPDGPRAPALSVAATRDGRLVAAGYADRIVRLWDLPSRRVLRIMRGHHGGGVCAVAIGDDGRWVVSGGTDGSVCLWMHESDGMMTTQVEAGPRVRAVAVSGDGDWAASGDDEGVIRVWDAKPASLVRQLRSVPPRVVLICVAPDRHLGTAVARGLVQRGIATQLHAAASPVPPPEEGGRRAVERGELVVPLISPRSLETGWIDREVEHAQTLLRPLLPVVTRERADVPYDLPAWLRATKPLVLTPHELETSATEVSFRIAERLDSPAPPQEASAGTKGPAAPPRKQASARKQGSGSMAVLPRPTRRKK